MEIIKQEEAQLGTWPRRLVHVPTFTSCEWQEGNVYNGIKEPRYVAISYTWGRWALKPGVKPEVKSIPIQGVDWDIPRVDPDRFTVADLQNVLQNITGQNRDVQNAYNRTLQLNQEFVVRELLDPDTQTRYASQEAPNNPPVEFVWLDVACIDQRFHAPYNLRAAHEIGRQYAIFTRATRIYIWLTTQESTAAQKRYDSIRRLGQMCVKTLSLAAQRNNFPSETLESLPDEESAQIASDVQNFLSDGWFSSLWTYQEGVISDRAGLLISRDGKLLVNSIPKSARSVDPPFQTLYGNIDSLIDFETVVTRWWHSTSSPKRDQFAQILQLIDQCGVKTLFQLNEVDAYAAANRRTASYEEDRIYGIQAIFGPEMRLGKTALDHNLGRKFSRRKLEDQLGAKLLTTPDFMVKSQWHTFTKNVPPERRWCLREESIGPHFRSNCALLPEYAVEHCCLFDISKTENSAGPSHVVTFTGQIISLDNFVEVCRSISFPDTSLEELSDDETEIEGIRCVHQLLRIIPDAADELSELDPPPGGDMERFYKCWCDYFQEHSIENPPTDQRDVMTNWLLANMPELHILRVARSFKPEDSESVEQEDDFDGWFGILLLQCGQGNWTRVGFCEVEVTGLTFESVGQESWDCLNGRGSMWQATGGIYGEIAEDPWTPDPDRSSLND